MSIFINGNVITLENNKICSAFRVKDGIFTDVGENEYILSLKKSNEEIIDLKGKTIIPGFNDGHMHFLNYAIQKNNVDLLNIPSIEEMINRTQYYIQTSSIADGEWILSRGWNHNLFTEQRLPNRYDLDKISTKHPIYFARVCGHIGVANSKALELLNITSTTENPDGGVIDKENGEPTGILRENALNLISNSMPPLSKEQIKKLLCNAFKDALKVGLTTIQTEDLTHCGSLENLLEAYKELEQEGNLPIRFILQLNLPDEKSIKKASSMGLKSNLNLNTTIDENCNSSKSNLQDIFVNSTKVKIGPIKLFEDGSLGGRTASMIEKYCDADTNGVLIYPQETLDKVTKAANDANFQITIHAIGDNASQVILNSYEKIIKDSKNKDLRPTIVHCQFTNDELLNKFRKLNIVANVQPAFVMTDYPIVEKAVGKTRAEKSYVWKDMLCKGIPLTFSSDAPIESFNPIEGIYAAVTRKDLKGHPQEGWYSTQNLTVTEALTAYTLGSAYMSFEENIKGTISKGKLADFVILSENILEVEKDRIKDIYVLETYVDGVRKY